MSKVEEYKKKDEELNANGNRIKKETSDYDRLTKGLPIGAFFDDKGNIIDQYNQMDSATKAEKETEAKKILEDLSKQNQWIKEAFVAYSEAKKEILDQIENKYGEPIKDAAQQAMERVEGSDRYKAIEKGRKYLNSLDNSTE